MAESIDWLTLDGIKTFHLRNDRRRITPLLDLAGTTPERIFEVDSKRFENADRVRYFSEGTRIVMAAYNLSCAEGSDDLRTVAVDYADFLLKRFVQPEGHFVEYEKCPWLTPETLWGTIPWGTAFHGNDMVSMYQLLCKGFDLEQQYRWRAALENTGRWIYKNPIIGGYVFNCGIDLLRLLWRIGSALDNSEWERWGMEKAHELIHRDMDDEGWIQGENGGVSGHYQLLGSDFIAQLAWESGDSFLAETTHRLMSLHKQFSTPTMFWNGNFGTRSNELNKIGRRMHILIAAALKNPVAAYFVKHYGHPSASRDLNLWREALSTPEEKPSYKQVVAFPGIQSTVVREGPYQAWFCNYGRSIWTRGYAGLWNSKADDAIFSTLHSLPSRIEKAKLRLEDTEDWAGFPHVMVKNGDEKYNSHQEMSDLKLDQNDGVRVTWGEALLSDSKAVGGQCDYQYWFRENSIQIHLTLSNLVGKTWLDFHLMRKTDQYYTLWTEQQLLGIAEDRLLKRGRSLDLAFTAGKMKSVGVQINNIIYRFQLNEIPEDSEIHAGMLKANGLHTRNHGGVRLQIRLPEEKRNAKLGICFDIGIITSQSSVSSSGGQK